MYLVTGGAGFIGSHLVETLVAQNKPVSVLDNFSSGSWENLDPCQDHIQIIRGDVTDFSTVLHAMAGAEYVLHHAAISSVDQSLQDPQKTHNTNVQGTLNVLLAARENNLRRLVFASSASVYGNAAGLPLSEDISLHALSPYAASKIAGEAYVRAFAVNHGLPAVILRYFNIYGPRQSTHSSYSGVITKFIDVQRRNQAPLIFGDGLQTRDFVYIQDVIQTSLMACDCPKAIGQVFNIASGQQISILALAQTLGNIMDCYLTPRFAPQQAGQVRRSQADISRARQILKWQPKTSLHTGLEKTAQGFSNHGLRPIL